jgi:hypothetical protein
LLPNRLTYPELLPVEMHDDHIYKNENDLYDKLCLVITRIDSARKTNMRSIAEQYDWSKMTTVYDELFASFI